MDRAPELLQMRPRPSCLIPLPPTPALLPCPHLPFPPHSPLLLPLPLLLLLLSLRLLGLLWYWGHYFDDAAYYNCSCYDCYC